MADPNVERFKNCDDNFRGLNQQVVSYEMPAAVYKIETNVFK